MDGPSNGWDHPQLSRQPPELPRTGSRSRPAARFLPATTTGRPAGPLLLLLLPRLWRRALRAGLTWWTGGRRFLGFAGAAIFRRDLRADQLFNRAQLVAVFT
jgi:hypothetical protein